MTPLRWTERTFRFDAPLALLPSLVERVRGTPSRLEEAMSGYPPQILTVKLNARWSIQEHAGHLLDMEELHAGRLDDYKFRLPVLRAADMTNKRTFSANHNSAPVAQILASFRAARLQFVHRVELLGDDAIGATAMHPRLHVPMRVVDMVAFVAEHDDHHLALMRAGASAVQ